MSRLSKDRVSELKTITACVESFDSIEDASLDFVATLSGGIRDLLADREAILAELKLAEGLSVKFHDEWLKSQAELAACRAELAEWQSAMETIIDSILHGRHQLAESTIDSDDVNAVLGIIDDNMPEIKA